MEKQFEIRPSRKSKLKTIRKNYIDGLVKYRKNNNLGLQKFSTQKLREIKAKIRKQLAQDRKKRLIFTFLSVFFISAIIFSLLLSIFKQWSF